MRRKCNECVKSGKILEQSKICDLSGHRCWRCERVCKVCGKKFIGIGECCSKICASRGSREAASNTMIARYGGVASGSKIIKEKIEQTVLQRYGVKNVYQYEGTKKKIRETNLIRRGVECSLQDPNVRGKQSKTLFERYGCTNAFFANGNPKISKISKLNKEFATILESESLSYELEKVVHVGNEWKSFDFLIENKILLDLNPSYTHAENIDFAFLTGKKKQNNPSPKKHLERLLFALSAGYDLISLFDWMEREDTLSVIKYKLGKIPEIDSKLLNEAESSANYGKPLFSSYKLVKPELTYVCLHGRHQDFFSTYPESPESYSKILEVLDCGRFKKI